MNLANNFKYPKKIADEKIPEKSNNMEIFKNVEVLH